MARRHRKVRRGESLSNVSQESCSHSVGAEMVAYKYLPIRDALECLNQKVSFFGIVSEVGLPEKLKRGSDWMFTLTIIDNSHPKRGITAYIYADNIEKLPRVASLGDIVLLCDVTMKSYFALYDHRHDGDLHPYHSSPLLQISSNSKYVATLRQWIKGFLHDEDSEAFNFLREIREGQNANLACKVLHVFETAENSWTALVWDGTECSPTLIVPKSEDELDKNGPLHLKLGHRCRELLTTFPTYGSTLRLKFEKGTQKHVLPLVQVGKWVRFLNIRCEARAGVWYGLLMPKAKLRFVGSDGNLELRSKQLQASSKVGYLPYWCFKWRSTITGVDHEHVPFVTLMDALTYSQVVGKFKSIVRVVACVPWRVEDFCFGGTYRICLTIEDATARIYAYLYAEDGEKFFNGYPSSEVLSEARNRLLGVATGDEEEHRSPPWVQLCLFSYHVASKDPWGSRQFRIFATNLI